MLITNIIKFLFINEKASFITLTGGCHAKCSSCALCHHKFSKYSKSSLSFYIYIKGERGPQYGPALNI